MDERYAEDFFVANRWVLRCAGLWSPESHRKIILILYKIYSIGIFLFNVHFTIAEFVSIYWTYGDEYDLIKTIGMVLTHVMAAIKVVFFYLRGNKLLEIMNILESKEFHYDSCTEKDFFPGSTSKRYKTVGIKCTVLFFVLAHATLLFSYLPPAVSTLLLMCGQQRNQQEVLFKLPYYSWMPFEYNTAESYLVALGYQALPMFSYAYSIVGMDTLFMNIMNAIGFNLTVIQSAFLTITDRAVKRSKHAVCSSSELFDSEELKLILHNEMKKICRHLQTVYKVCEDLENLHKYLTLSQMTATLIILCSCFYLVSSTPIASKQFCSEIVYMAAVGFELTLYCWFGNEVTLKAAELPSYIWQCDWLRTDNNFKKSMILTMARAKKPVYLTAGNFAPLTLSTFVSIIKGSYSFFTVIKSTSE